ncbi:MAG: hypothetical protein GF308_10635 [Candidatus Heimdallarchaeota archaeon]|nr:hypothetical protein [Candidatus Heimdallarchaeota archaeon]
MNIPLEKLKFEFSSKPLLIGGRAMEYHGIRKAGEDFDLIITGEDYKQLAKKYPNHTKDLWGDLGVCVDKFELWQSILLFDYYFLSEGAIEEKDYLVISLEKLLFMKALTMREPKSLADLELIVNKIIKRKYTKALEKAPQEWSHREKIMNWLKEK